MKKLIKDLEVGDKFYYCCGTYEVKEILEEQVLTRKISTDCNVVYYSLFHKTSEEVELVEKIKLKDLFIGARFKFTSNPYANDRERRVVYKDDVVILYVNDYYGDYLLVREGDTTSLWDEEVEVIPYVEEA